MGRSVMTREYNYLLEDQHRIPVEMQEDIPEDALQPKLPKHKFEEKDGQATGGKLFRQVYLLVIVSLYSCLSVIAWTMICVQSRRPITYKTYKYHLNEGSLAEWNDRVRSNVEWLRTVRVILSATYSLIIPLTSTVCASAAVIYVQQFGQTRRISMQQTSTLGDKGWISPQVWFALLRIRGWKSQGSFFLVFAMALHALGT